MIRQQCSLGWLYTVVFEGGGSFDLSSKSGLADSNWYASTINLENPQSSRCLLYLMRVGGAQAGTADTKIT